MLKNTIIFQKIFVCVRSTFSGHHVPSISIKRINRSCVVVDSIGKRKQDNTLCNWFDPTREIEFYEKIKLGQYYVRGRRPRKRRSAAGIIGTRVQIAIFNQFRIFMHLVFLQEIRPFKGCMQGFSVNHQEEELISEKAIRHKVGQCFPQVEKGSFFPGDAYAIYSEWLKTNNHIIHRR